MSDLASLFNHIPADSKQLVLDRYILKSNPDISIEDASPIGGGFCPGQNMNDGTFASHISRDTLDEAMTICLKLAQASETTTQKDD